MTLLSVVEDRPTPRQVYNWRIWMLAAVASCASCMIGYDSAFIGQTVELNSFRDEFHFGDWSEAKQDLVKANIVSLYQAGAFFGALFAYPIGFFWGRKWGLWITSIVFTLGSGLMLGANSDRGLGIMYAGRVLAGLGVGSGSNLTPIYISELSPPAVRGRLVGIYELGWQIGGLVGFWINVCLSPMHFPHIYIVYMNTTDSHGSSEFRKPFQRAINNGSSPSPFSLFPPACSCSVLCSSASLPVGYSVVAGARRP